MIALRTTTRRLIVAAGAALAIVPSRVLAHDGIGGDELAVANWMLVAALVTVILGLMAGAWAWRNGQFTDIEASKYTMLELADDYDALYASDGGEQETRPRGNPPRPPGDHLAPGAAGPTK